MREVHQIPKSHRLPSLVVNVGDRPMSDKSITVLYFAAAYTATGLQSERVEIPPEGLPLLSLSAELVRRHPDVGLNGVLATSQWSVDAAMVDDPDTLVLKGGEEVAVICPVSGG